VKRFIPLVAAVVIAAVVLLKPTQPPGAVAGGWSSPGPEPRGRRALATPAPRALAYVAGEVARPGVYQISPDARVRDALAAAGGTRPNADLVAVNLAAHVRDGDEIVVLARGAAAPPGSRSHGARRYRHSAGGASRAKHGRHRRSPGAAPPAAPVDINSADAPTLATIPGIGDGLAERIVAFREQNGPFASIDELLDVAGITEHRLDAMIPYVVAR
jgi:competence protein ComEA